MKTNIYFIRHAECESNANSSFVGVTDGLTEKGIEQSKTIATYFKDRNILNVYSSNILRAQLTAKEICDLVHREVIVLEFLKERSIVYKGIDDWVYKEDADSFKIRLSQAKNFLQNLPEGDFIVVSHAIFLKAFISYLLLENFFTEELSNQISSGLIIDNASISKLMFNKEKGKWKLDYINKKLV